MTAQHEGDSRARNDVGITSNSMHTSIGVYWVVPMLCVAALSRFAVDTGPPFAPQQTRPISVNFASDIGVASPQTSLTEHVIQDEEEEAAITNLEQEYLESYLSNKPVGYREVVKAIGRRRLDWSSASTEPLTQYKRDTLKTQGMQHGTGTKSRKDSASQADPPVRGASSDPARMGLLREIDRLRKAYSLQPGDLLLAIDLADSLRMYDVQYHDGGTMQQEAILVYEEAIEMVTRKRAQALQRGEETNRALTGDVDINEEVVMDYATRSLDGLLCALFTSLGKVYFMANMFEKAVSSYSEAIKIEPTYLDALSSRGSSLIILGKYSEAARDFISVIEMDTKRRFLDCFTGLARVLQTKEDASPTGWDPILSALGPLIPLLESQMQNIQQEEGRKLVGSSLARLHHVLFLYHDSKTKDVDSAWNSLTRAYKYKMKSLPPWNKGFETQKIEATKQIFHKGFWPNVGSEHDSPIFVIGFVRSGSTLLERILDAHPEIAGTGENSVFNGKLDSIRNRIVQVSMLGDSTALNEEVNALAAEVVDEMRDRWDAVASAEGLASNSSKPRKYVDKMLTNYLNVGFIHMLFPKAIILHVFREPMDTIFSAYKHEFPPGPLDYTSSFDSLAELYHGYRDLMEHWDAVLPGRIFHIKYEDMVRDTPGVSKAIIDAAGLDWHDEVLHFHKKKHAVNTLSTTQVRKGIYTDSLQAWRRYEGYLKPLVQEIGLRVHYNLSTSLPGYSAQHILAERSEEGL